MKNRKQRLSCQKEWEKRKNLYARGNKLLAKSKKFRKRWEESLPATRNLDKQACKIFRKNEYSTTIKVKKFLLFERGNAFWTEALRFGAKWDRLMQKSNELWAEGHYLKHKGDEIFAAAVLRKHGNVEMQWSGDKTECQIKDKATDEIIECYE